ncbi:hypothetical protein D3C73_1519360 [compost metagenome]
MNMSPFFRMQVVHPHILRIILAERMQQTVFIDDLGQYAGMRSRQFINRDGAVI